MSRSGLKTAALFRLSVAALVQKHAVERLGVLTLTFSRQVTNSKQAQEQFRSFRAHVLQARYPDWIRVFERQKSGRIHYHVILVLAGDIRTGYDLESSGHGTAGKCPALLREERAFLQKAARKFGFGRISLDPIRKNAAALASYFAKELTTRDPRSKGVRLVEYSRAARVGNTRFSWFNPSAVQWRSNVDKFAERLGCGSHEELGKLLGPRWAHTYWDLIISLSDPDTDERAREFDLLKCAVRTKRVGSSIARGAPAAAKTVGRRKKKGAAKGRNPLQGACSFVGRGANDTG